MGEFQISNLPMILIAIAITCTILDEATVPLLASRGWPAICHSALLQCLAARGTHTVTEHCSHGRVRACRHVGGRAAGDRRISFALRFDACASCCHHCCLRRSRSQGRRRCCSHARSTASGLLDIPRAYRSATGLDAS